MKIRVRGPRMVVWLIATNLVFLALPIVMLLGFELYDAHLLRLTEQELIAQSVVIGEAYREAWAKSVQRAIGNPRPPTYVEDRYAPVQPALGLGMFRKRESEEREVREGREGREERLSVQSQRAQELSEQKAEQKAGQSVEPLLRRAQIFNLSAVRILDKNGCVTATTKGDEDRCLGSRVEVASALQGRYDAEIRQRISDEPLPWFDSMRRRGDVRVFTALPVLNNGGVIGVIHASRTGVDGLSSLWEWRRSLVIFAGMLLFIAVVSSFGLTYFLARPIMRLKQRAHLLAESRVTHSKQSEHSKHKLPTITRWAPAEVHELSETLDSLADKLRSRADYITEFALTASHELKTPMTAVQGAAELLREQGAVMSEAQRDRFLDNMVDDIQRMRRQVGGLLTLARLESAHETQRAQPVSQPIEVVSFAQALLRRHGDAVELNAKTDAGGDVSDGVWVHMPPEHLETILTNLVENALRHHAQGSHTQKSHAEEKKEAEPVVVQIVHTQAPGHEHAVSIEVTDRGPGIRKANRARVFERFFTTERDVGGTGLGLAIVKAMLDNHGGKIIFQTSEEGTTFVVFLCSKVC